MASDETGKRPATSARLSAPVLPRIVLRQRLLDRLFEARNRAQSTWLFGPPGAGKTTLAASYVEYRGVRCTTQATGPRRAVLSSDPVRSESAVHLRPFPARRGRFTCPNHDRSSEGSTDLNFYDYETSAHVQLKLDGDKFKGYDYHTGAHFSGTVRGGSISLYDYETGQYYNFSA